VTARETRVAEVIDRRPILDKKGGTAEAAPPKVAALEYGATSGRKQDAAVAASCLYVIQKY
jgi:hypothetical protein